MQWSSSDLAAQAEKDFEATWMKTIDLVPTGGYESKKKSTPHPEAELIQKLRQAFLSEGYSEMMLPVFIEEEDMQKQLGPEASLAVTDTFMVSTLPRVKPELGAEALKKIQPIASTFNEERLTELDKLMDSYLKEEFGSQRLLSLMVERTGVRMDQAVEIATLFLGKQSSTEKPLLLRHGISPSWFKSLKALVGKEPFPLQLFSIGSSFRRGDLKANYFASAAIMSKNVSFEDGVRLLNKLFIPLNIEIKFEKSSATSKLFIPGTEMLIFSKGLRLGRLGMISPIALSAYDLEMPTLVFEFSVERLGVVLGLGPEDKAVHYPQFFGEWEMTDKGIAELVRIDKKPTDWGREISSKIIKTCELYASKPAPCEFKLLEKEIGENNIEIWLVSEKGTLCGKDYANELLIHDGNILSSPAIPINSLAKEASANGIKTGITLFSAFADYAAALIEQNPDKSQHIEVGQIADPAETNIVVPELVRRYIKSKNTVLDVSGELGITVESRVKRLWRHEQPR